MKIESFQTIRKRNFAEILENFMTPGHSGQGIQGIALSTVKFNCNQGDQ